MPSSYEYGTFANYSPRGTSELSKRSRGTCGAVKAGRVDIIASAVPHLRDPKADKLKPFLGPFLAWRLLVPTAPSITTPGGFCELDHW